jgi:hypothetical protein
LQAGFALSSPKGKTIFVSLVSLFIGFWLALMEAASCDGGVRRQRYSVQQEIALNYYFEYVLFNK